MKERLGKKGKEFYGKMETFVPEELIDLVQKKLTIVDVPSPSNLFKKMESFLK